MKNSHPRIAFEVVITKRLIKLKNTLNVMSTGIRAMSKCDAIKYQPVQLCSSMDNIKIN